MTTPVVSFQKKVRNDISAIPGTKPSIQNAQLLVSTGIPSLDFILGGGQPVGTILIVDEDTYKEYSNVLFKYFLAEGVVCGHSLLVASLDENPKTLVSELSAPVSGTSDKKSGEKLDSNAESLKIAWRYENINPINSQLESANTFGHNFDLSKSFDKGILDKINIRYWDGYANPEKEERSKYIDLLEAVHDEISSKNFSTDLKLEFSERNILRIGIQSLASPFWHGADDISKDIQAQNLNRFLYKLRALVRSAFAVAIITIPAHLLQTENILRIRHLADFSFSLESFTGSSRATNPLFKEYHGLFHVHKIAAINSLASPAIQTRDLAFKLRRKKFCIEKLHLPPELQESAEREQDDTAMLSCGSSKKHLLEF